MSYTNGLDKPSDYFTTKLYTGNGSTQTISSVGFQPDWTWIKHRNGATAHMLFDSVRGALYRLQSNSSNTQTSAANTLTSWNSDGFALGTENDTNGNGRLFASWNWLAGTSFTNDASSTGIGSLDSSGTVNETAGFSIVKYTGNGSSGATIKHGLSTAPTAMFVRVYDAAAGFQVYNVGTGNTKFASYLNTTEAAGTTAGAWNNTTPTSSVFTVGNGGNTNNNGGTHIAYIFSERQGFSKFGVYKGNGQSSDGTYVHLGFKPAWVMIKITDNASQDWFVLDNKRSPFNLVDESLAPNQADTEYTSEANLDFLSNGFKLKMSSIRVNGSGNEYSYYAFAENPFVTSTGVPTTAR